MELNSSESTRLPPSVRVGSVLEGRYRIVSELGSGGVGTVFRAEHLKLGHPVAIKVLQPHLVADVQFRPRFEREARALASLAHPHVVAWTDFSTAEGCPYLVMELLEGRSLRVDIAKGPIAPARVKRILHQTLATLVHAHKLGFVHRDLKPDNVFLLDFPSEPDFVKLLDFGFVKLVRPDGASPEQSQLTVSGMGMGTPAYMSPEQAWGDKTGPASDLYSLGILAFEMLTGTRPFVGDVAVIVRQHMSEPLPALRVESSTANEALQAFLARATEKRATDRFESAQAMLEALDAIPEPWLEPRRRFGRSVRPRPRIEVGGPSRPLRYGAPLIGLALLAGAAGFAAVHGDQRHIASSHRAAPSRASHARAAVARVEPPVAPAPTHAEPTTPSPTDAPSVPVLGPSPFDSRPRLPLLWSAHRQLLAGRGLARSTEVAILRWSRTQPRDPRPSLLLAGDAARSHADASAVSLYVTSSRIASDARNDPRMARDLVRIAAAGRAQRPAAEAVVSIFGPLALGVVDEELLRLDLTQAERARLTRLRARLASAEPPSTR